MLYCTVLYMIQGQYSGDLATTFVTPPRRDTGLQLDPVVLPGATSITARWRGFEKLSCIRQYQVGTKTPFYRISFFRRMSDAILV